MFGLLQRFSTPARWGLRHTQWALGISDPHEWIDFYRHFTVRGLEDRLRNPMLFLFGEDDIKDVAAASAAIVAGIPKFISSLPCDQYVHVFPRTQGASSHCQMDGLSYANAIVFQWLNHLFDDRPLPDGSTSASAESVINLFRRHGGERAATKTGQLLRTATLV